MTSQEEYSMKKILPLVLLCLLLPLLAGCTASPEAPEPTPVVIETQIPSPPQIVSPVIIAPEEFSRVIITLDAQPLPTDPALLLTLGLDAKESRGSIPREGYSVTMAFFAYNVDSKPAGYSPKTAAELRTSGIPYKTRTMLIYPDNIINHREQVPEVGSQTGIFNPNLPYIYGIIIEMREG
jgi:hypothetical protein